MQVAHQTLDVPTSHSCARIRAAPRRGSDISLGARPRAGFDVPPTDERKAPFSGPSVPGDHRTSGSMHGPAQSAEARTGTEPWIRRHGRTAAAAAGPASEDVPGGQGGRDRDRDLAHPRHPAAAKRLSAAGRASSSGGPCAAECAPGSAGPQHGRNSRAAAITRRPSGL